MEVSSVECLWGIKKEMVNPLWRPHILRDTEKLRMTLSVSVMKWLMLQKFYVQGRALDIVFQKLKGEWPFLLFCLWNQSSIGETTCCKQISKVMNTSRAKGYFWIILLWMVVHRLLCIIQWTCQMHTLCTILNSKSVCLLFSLFFKTKIK